MVLREKIGNFPFCCNDSEGLTLEVSKFLLKHRNFNGKIKTSKIEKDEDWVV